MSPNPTKFQLATGAITWAGLGSALLMVSISTMCPHNQQKKQFCPNSVTPIDPCIGLLIIWHHRCNH